MPCGRKSWMLPSKVKMKKNPLRGTIPFFILFNYPFYDLVKRKSKLTNRSKGIKIGNFFLCSVQMLKSDTTEKMAKILSTFVCRECENYEWGHGFQEDFILLSRYSLEKDNWFSFSFHELEKYISYIHEVFQTFLSVKVGWNLTTFRINEIVISWKHFMNLWGTARKYHTNCKNTHFLYYYFILCSKFDLDLNS